MGSAFRPPGAQGATPRQAPPRPPGPEIERRFAEGEISLTVEGLLTWSSINTSEVEIVEVVDGEFPRSVVLPPRGQLQISPTVVPRYRLVQLYNHSSGFRGELLGVAQPLGLLIGQIPAGPGAFWQWDPDGVLTWVARGVDRAEVFLSRYNEFAPEELCHSGERARARAEEYATTLDEMIDSGVGPRAECLQGKVLLPGEAIEQKTHIVILGYDAGGRHTMADNWLNGGCPGGSHRGFALRPPRGATLTPLGSGWRYPKAEVCGQ